MEWQVAQATCEDEEFDEPYEFENVAEGPTNKINGIKVNKRKKNNDVKIQPRPAVDNISNNNPMKSDPSIVGSGFTYNQSQFPKNMSSYQDIGSGVMSSNQHMSNNTKQSLPQKFRMSTDGSHIIVPKNYSIGIGSNQRISQETYGNSNPSNIFTRVQEENEEENHIIAKDSKSSNFSMVDRQSIKSP